jgi:hypothetical protein
MLVIVLCICAVAGASSARAATPGPLAGASLELRGTHLGGFELKDKCPGSKSEFKTASGSYFSVGGESKGWKFSSGLGASLQFEMVDGKPANFLSIFFADGPEGHFAMTVTGGESRGCTQLTSSDILVRWTAVELGKGSAVYEGCGTGSLTTAETGYSLAMALAACSGSKTAPAKATTPPAAKRTKPKPPQTDSRSLPPSPYTDPQLYIAVSRQLAAASGPVDSVTFESAIGVGIVEYAQVARPLWWKSTGAAQLRDTFRAAKQACACSGARAWAQWVMFDSETFGDSNVVFHTYYEFANRNYLSNLAKAAADGFKYLACSVIQNMVIGGATHWLPLDKFSKAYLNQTVGSAAASRIWSCETRFLKQR